MKIIHIYLYTTWFLILLPEFIALSDETDSEVMTTKVASRFPVFAFSAPIAISNIENKWIVKSCIQVFSESTEKVLKFEECISDGAMFF